MFLLFIFALAFGTIAELTGPNPIKMLSEILFFAVSIIFLVGVTVVAVRSISRSSARVNKQRGVIQTRDGSSNQNDFASVDHVWIGINFGMKIPNLSTVASSTVEVIEFGLQPKVGERVVLGSGSGARQTGRRQPLHIAQLLAALISSGTAEPMLIIDIAGESV